MTRPDDDRWHFSHKGPGVYILCRRCSARRGSILLWDDGRYHMALKDCLIDGPLAVDPIERDFAMVKARRLGRMVSLRATPTR
jgi:hypothetical protein